MLRLTLIIFLITAIVAPSLSQEVNHGLISAPQFSLKDLNGKTVALSNFKDKVILLNFWATWCAPCRAEMPDLVNLQEEYRARGLQVIGITYPAYRKRDVQNIARQLKVNYPILLGNRELAAKYNISDVLPVTIVIDRAGRVRGHILGIMEPEEFDQIVKPILDK